MLVKDLPDNARQVSFMIRNKTLVCFAATIRSAKVDVQRSARGVERNLLLLLKCLSRGGAKV